MGVFQDNQLAFQVLLGQQVLAKISQQGQGPELDVDQFLGPVSYLKVLSGTIRTDDVLVNTRSRARERCRQLLSIEGAALRPTAAVTAGSIVAVAKLGDSRTGDTLSVAGSPVAVPAPQPPEAVYGIAIRAATPADRKQATPPLEAASP